MDAPFFVVMGMVMGPGPESFMLIGRGMGMDIGTGPESFMLMGMLIGRGMGMVSGPESHYVSPKILYGKHSEGGCPPPCASILW